ncbi:MAG: phage portal protein [Defluviitaleaceae bacterium]|nr:phage portal protein [Defluviitaleaceae bacterium]
MGVLNRIGQALRPTRRPRAASQLGVKEFFELLKGYSPAFTNMPEALYEMELIRAAIGSFARFCSMLQPEIRGQGLPHMERQWQRAINPYMTTSQFLARVATILEVSNNAFIIPLEDSEGRLIGFYPLLPHNCELVEFEGATYLRYMFSNGKRAAIEFNRVGVLNQHQYENDFFGESNAALKPTMQLIHTNNQGIIAGVKNSAQIRFIAKIANMLDPEDIKRERDRFSEENLSEENKSGFMIYDNKFSDVTQVKSDQYTINAAQMKEISLNVFRYFGTNEDILQNKYNEEGFNAYFQGKIEPFAIQISLVLSIMIFSERQIAHGNDIIFNMSRLEFASIKTRTDLSTAFFDRGLLNRKEIRKILGLPAVEDDDSETFFIRSEYTRLEDLGKSLYVEAAKEGIDIDDPQANIPQPTEGEDDGAGTGGAHKNIEG